MKLLGKMAIVTASIMAISIGAMAVETGTTTTTTTTPPAASVPAENNTDVKSNPRSAGFYTYVQTRYSLTDAQVADLKAAKMNSNQTLRVAELAKMSGKSVEDVMKMRYEQKMGWGRIAKELNLREKEVSHAVNKARSEQDSTTKADMRDEENEQAKNETEDQGKDGDKRKDHADKMKTHLDGRKNSGVSKGPGASKDKH